jgi:heme-degrading monooxygenase HmoA
MSVYTMGIWQVKPGSEEDFVAAWQEMADWTMREVEAAQAGGTLLRDREQPNRFVSFGPWPDEQAIASWRGSSGFKERISRIRNLLQDFSPATLDPVATQG